MGSSGLAVVVDAKASAAFAIVLSMKDHFGGCFYPTSNMMSLLCAVVMILLRLSIISYRFASDGSRDISERDEKKEESSKRRRRDEERGMSKKEMR